MAKSCIIVGAGIAGLTAARRLREAEWEVVLLDKARKPGGRMAARQVGGIRFDTGAQFFTVRERRFREQVDAWLDAGAAVQWGNGFSSGDRRMAPDGHPRYRGVPHMRGVPEHLADGLDLRCGERVNALAAADGAWRVKTESGGEYEAAALILTPPVPQSLDLVRESGIELPHDQMEKLAAIEYDPCLALMAVLEAPSKIPAPGGVRMPADEIGWMADNQQKGLAEAPAVTIHASPAFSRANYEAEEDLVRTLLLGAASPWIPSEATETHLHRWRYSQPVRCYPEACAMVPAPAPLAFAGDGFGAPRVEGAFMSGMAAAEKLIEHE